MGKAINSILKVAWICHFSNSNIQKKLAVRKDMTEFAPWISLGIEEIKKRNDIELHVVSPHRWISGVRRFSDNNIHYHFFNSGIPLIGRHWPGFFRFDYYTGYYSNRFKIKKIIRAINPDIINLHGVENPYYSKSILDLKSYPNLITIQGLKSLNSFNRRSKFEKSTICIEQKIIKDFYNFGIRAKFLQEYIGTLNPNAKFYWFKYPFKSNIESVVPALKTYDCVFFASISKEKGIEDLISAIKLVKLSIPTISLKIIGRCDNDYKGYLLNRISQYGLLRNVEFLGFLPSHFEVHRIASEAKLSILPTYNDILPGTIIESLKARIPVIAYAANGVVDFNDQVEAIRLVNVGDIKELANQIIYLLKNSQERDKLVANGLKIANEYFNNTTEIDKMINSYKLIINKKD